MIELILQNHQYQSITNENRQTITFSVKSNFNWNPILPNPDWIFSGRKKLSIIQNYYFKRQFAF